MDDRISADELDLVEKKQAVEELLKERRRTKVLGWRDTVVAEGGVTQMAAVGSRSYKAEGDLLLSEVGVHQKDTEECQKSLGQVKTVLQKRRAVVRVEWAETQDCVSAPLLTSRKEQETEAED